MEKIKCMCYRNILVKTELYSSEVIYIFNNVFNQVFLFKLEFQRSMRSIYSNFRSIFNINIRIIVQVIVL